MVCEFTRPRGLARGGLLKGNEEKGDVKMPVREVTAVRINVCYDRFVKAEGREPTEDEIYQIARWAWKRLCPQQLVFACVKGRIRGVYEVVGKWYWCGEARGRSELQPDYPNAPKFQEIRIREIKGNIEKNDRILQVDTQLKSLTSETTGILMSISICCDIAYHAASGKFHCTHMEN